MRADQWSLEARNLGKTLQRVNVTVSSKFALKLGMVPYPLSGCWRVTTVLTVLLYDSFRNGEVPSG
jgi:hypothetical protein